MEMVVEVTCSSMGVVLHVIKSSMKHGIEVKLQRNALSVLEAPTGIEDEEDDEDLECENIWSGLDMVLPLVIILRHGGFPLLYAWWSVVPCRNIHHFVIKLYAV